MKRSTIVLALVGAMVGAVLLVPQAGALPKGAGARFLYSQDGVIRMMNSDGTGDHQFSSGFISPGPSMISPKGNKIAYISADGGNGEELRVVNTDGTGEHDVTLSDENPVWPSWNKDGTRIGFSRFHSGTSQMQFFTVKPNGTDERRETKGNQYSIYSPVFSPTSNQVLYARKDNANQYDVCKMKGDGTFLKCLAHTALFESPGDWSPGGDKVLYLAYPDVGPPFWVTATADGKNKTPVATPEADLSYAFWPKGGFIVYEFYDGGDNEISHVRPNGSDHLQLTNNALNDTLIQFT